MVPSLDTSAVRVIALLSALSLPAWLVAPGVAMADTATASETVETLHAALLDVMRNARTLGYAGRRDRLAPVIERTFDLPLITEVVMGTNWSTLSPEQRARMADTFARLTVSTYAHRFDGFDGERFVTRSTQELRPGRVGVRTALERRGESDVSLDYLLQSSARGWRIINVVADGVSDLALKRADYASIMARDGFDVLVQRLEQQITEQSAAG